MSKIMIIGGSGYLGSNLALFTRRIQKHDVYSTYLEHGCSSKFDIKLDITNKFSVSDTLKKIEPEVVIHAAAITSSNYCATHRQLAWKINVEGTKNVVDAVSEVGSRLIYISTDQVYSGEKLYSTEADTPVPICFYGQTKLEAEHVVTSRCRNYCIARTSLIYGLSKTNKKTFFDVFIGNLLNNKHTKLFCDEYRTPIFLDNYCAVLMELVTKQKIQGLYNISGRERVSRYEMGEHISKALSKDMSLLIPVSMYDYKFIDKRPEDCSMSNKVITELLTTTVIGIEKSSAIIKNQLAVSSSENIAYRDKDTHR